jgi:hypothetical protein
MIVKLKDQLTSCLVNNAKKDISNPLKIWANAQREFVKEPIRFKLQSIIYHAIAIGVKAAICLQFQINKVPNAYLRLTGKNMEVVKGSQITK